MTVIEFTEKYTIGGAEAAGLENAMRYWAEHNFTEKLLVAVYIRTFGIYPGGMEGEIEYGSETISPINDDFVSDLTTFSSEKISEMLDIQEFEDGFYTDLLE